MPYLQQLILFGFNHFDRPNPKSATDNVVSSVARSSLAIRSSTTSSIM
jgi:hypothetical protein